MVVYDKVALANLELVEQSGRLKRGGFITEEQQVVIKKELPAFKRQSNFLVRLGFLLLGSFLYLSICGALSVLGLTSENLFFSISCYLFALVGFGGAEFFARQNYFGHGLDDAFVLGAILNVGLAVGITTDGAELLVAGCLAIAAFVLYKRYLHLGALAIFCIASTAVLFYGLFELGEVGKTILPFAALVLAAVFYWYTKKLLAHLTQAYYYKGILLANTYCLILFYLSCNYYVVRELSVALLGNEILPGTDIPFAWFFYAFTVVVPLVYLVQALKTKDRILLWVSFLAIAFSIYTIRFYYALLPIEIALTVGGLLLFALSFFAIKKLKNKETGITFQPDRGTSDTLIHAEALVVASAFGVKPESTPQSSPIDFGGGGFSGGGSQGGF